MGTAAKPPSAAKKKNEGKVPAVIRETLAEVEPLTAAEVRQLLATIALRADTWAVRLGAVKLDAEYYGLNQGKGATPEELPELPITVRHECPECARRAAEAS